MKIEDMNVGVQLLLKRMETNPEDFEDTGNYNRWGPILRCLMDGEKKAKDALTFLYPEEVEALCKKFRDVRRELFTAQMLRNIAGPEGRPTQEQMELGGFGHWGGKLNAPRVVIDSSGNLGLGTNMGPVGAVWAQEKEDEQIEAQDPDHGDNNSSVGEVGQAEVAQAVSDGTKTAA